MISDELRAFFAHETIRAGQEELIADLAMAFSEKKVLLAHAPTGLGKTASALSVALYFAFKSDKTVLFLTNRQTQHRIAIETLNLISARRGESIHCVDLLGKRSMCSQEVASLFGNDFMEFCKTIVERGECEFYNRVKSKKGVSVEAQALVSDIKRSGPVHAGELSERAQTEKMCGYEVSLLVGKGARVVIADYNYVFNPHVAGTLFA